MRQLTIALLLLAGIPLTGARAQEAPASNLESADFDSAALGRSVRVRVQLPPKYDAKQRYPVVYFLHGLRGSEKTWESRGADRIFASLVNEKKIPPMIVVAPNGANSFYINAKGRPDGRYADMIVKDLVAQVDKRFPTEADAKSRALLGDSMGGYGALLLAMKNPEVFGAVAAHEASVFPEDRSKLPRWVQQGRGNGPNLLNTLFGDPIDEDYWLDQNLFHLAKTAKPDRFKDLAIYFDVGKDDRYGLADPTTAWDKLLNEKKVAHTFQLREGSHGREFFLDNLPESLAFVGRAFTRDEKAGEKPAEKSGSSTGH